MCKEKLSSVSKTCGWGIVVLITFEERKEKIWEAWRLSVLVASAKHLDKSTNNTFDGKTSQENIFPHRFSSLPSYILCANFCCHTELVQVLLHFDFLSIIPIWLHIRFGLVLLSISTNWIVPSIYLRVDYPATTVLCFTAPHPSYFAKVLILVFYKCYLSQRVWQNCMFQHDLSSCHSIEAVCRVKEDTGRFLRVSLTFWRRRRV